MMPENVFDFSTALESCHAQKALALASPPDGDVSVAADCEVTWVVPADLPYLDGHFPQMPIVPAVAMIDASVVLIQQFSKQAELRLKTVKQAKFMAPITVGDQVTIHSRQGREGAWDVGWKNAQGHDIVRLVLLLS